MRGKAFNDFSRHLVQSTDAHWTLSPSNTRFQFVEL